MKAYTYVKPGLASFVDVDKPVISKPTDAIVRIVKTTICGTDLHIIKGDVPVSYTHLTLPTNREV